jgi:hypothetical protein
MFRRLESLFAALALLAALGGGYYFADLSRMPLLNLWSGLAVVAAALTFFGITVAVHGHQPHTRLSVFVGFLLAGGVALYVRSAYPAAQNAYLPEAGLLLLTVVCAELRVGLKEADTRKPEHVGAARHAGARRRRRN